MYKLLLCVRYLKTRYIALASIISVMLGVATMIVVNSVMAGFGSEMRNRIQGLLSDIVLDTTSTDGVTDFAKHKELIQKVAGKYIVAMTPTVEVYGMLTFQYAGQPIHRPVTLIGIDPDSKSEVGPLTDHLLSFQPEREDGKIVAAPQREVHERPSWNLTSVAAEHRREWARRQQWMLEQMRREREHDRRMEEEAGDRQSDADGESNPFDAEVAEDEVPSVEELCELLTGRIFIGAGLVSFPYEEKETGKIKTMYMVRPGDNVKLTTVTAGTPEPAPFNATVVDIFKSGMSEYDSNLVFCNLEYLQKVRNMIGKTPDGEDVPSFTTIQIKLHDYRDADKVVDLLKSAFPPGMYNVRTWEQKQGPLLAAVEIESAILNVLLFLIITVAGFGILAIFYMIVVEKTKDIGILKALGASSGGVMTIFLSYGLSLGLVGSGVGATIGLLFVHYINEIEALISMLTGRKVFDERIYYFPRIPTHVEPMMVFWVAFGAVLIAVLASILPARRAAQLHPVRALRYE